MSVSHPDPRLLTERYARCIEASQRARWDIDADLIRGRSLDFDKRFLPEGLARTGWMDFLGSGEQRLVNQLQGRTYANMLGLVERFIAAKTLEMSRRHWLGDQVALEALVRFADEEIKHQALFRRIDALVAVGLPPGYRFVPAPNAVADAVLAAGHWAVLALTCHIELFTQVHYRQSMQPDEGLSELFKDVFLFHWKEESQHAVLDELEWRHEDARLTPEQRDRAVNEFIGLLRALDGVLQAQAQADADYFVRTNLRRLDANAQATLRTELLAAYRWQFILSGAQEPRFVEALSSMISAEQGLRIQAALAPLLC